MGVNRKFYTTVRGSRNSRSSHTNQGLKKRSHLEIVNGESKTNGDMCLTLHFSVSNPHRNEIFITSKLWNEFHKAEDVEPALRQSLMNLGLKYLDLYLMHWPFAFERKHQTDIQPVDFSQKV